MPLLPALLASLALACAPPAPSPVPTAGVVAADHPLASEAGAEMLRAGGNAVDAAVAAALAAGVVQPQSSGLGGGGFAILAGPGLAPVALDFREVAPAAASAGMFLAPDGTPVPGLSEHGALAVAVPGEPRGLAALMRRHGTLDLAAVAAPAIRLAREGFPAGEALARAAATWSGEHGDHLFGELFDGGTGPPAVGQVLRRERLAGSLEAWATSDGEALSTGPRAAGFAEALRARGGIVTEADLAGYAVRARDPLVGRAGGVTLVTMPPPSSGGVLLLQALGVLEAWPPLGPDPREAADVHRTVEAFRHGFADRARWLGDPDHVDVPVAQLLGPERLAALREAIRATGEPPLDVTLEPGATPCRPLPPEAYGLPLSVGDDAGTHHISVIDGAGLAVALTTTINTSFGSGVVDPGTGILLNDQMDDFVVAPGVLNAYGLTGNERNAIAAGKRPLSSMTPTLALDAQGRPQLAIGASGGPRIITATFEVLRAVIEAGLDPEAAVALPRYHHQGTPNALRVEEGFPLATALRLAACGYDLRGPSPDSAVQVVLRYPDGRLAGASDPRKGGAPATVQGGPP